MTQSRLHPAVSSTSQFDYRYDLLEYKGGGNFGEVWRAHDTTTGRQVALKLLDPAQTTPNDAWHEATTLTSLRNPYTAQVHGAALSQVSIPYIDMEYIPGGSIAAATGPHGVPEASALRWALRATRGLHLCHTAGILHRDVKPDNLLISAAGNALLGDFGVAAIMAADGTADAHGDMEILAPEAFTGRCTVQSDVYSMGVTLYAMLTGRLPHTLADHSFNQAAFTSAVQTGVPDIRNRAPHLTLGIARVVHKATATNPTDRYATAHDFDAALSRLSAPTRTITPTTPCHPGGRCWDLTNNTTKQPIHVATRPNMSGKRVRIETRYLNGKRLTKHCADVTAGQTPARLKTIFRALL